MTNQRGPTHTSAKLTEADVLEIRRLWKVNTTLADLARQYPQCSKANIHNIVHGRKWQYLLEK